MTSSAGFPVHIMLLVSASFLMTACGTRGQLTLPPKPTATPPAQVKPAVPKAEPATPMVDDSSAARRTTEQ